MRRTAFAASLLFVLGFAPDALAESALERGRSIAHGHCSRCHVIGDFNSRGGIESTPSFPLLRRRDDWRERFQSFFERRPHPALVRIEGVQPWTKLAPTSKPVELTLDDVDAIVTFAKSLKQ